jgi:hypothetical protein
MSQQSNLIWLVGTGQKGEEERGRKGNSREREGEKGERGGEGREEG